jgi:hypothetical protein
LTSFSDAYGLHVTFIGTDQHVYQYSYDAGTNTWQPVKDLSGAATAPTWSPLTSFADDWGEHVFHTGLSNDVYALDFNFSFPGSGWVDTDLTKPAHGVAARFKGYDLASQNYGENVFYIGWPDGHLHQILWWLDHDLTPGESSNDQPQ